MKEWYKVETLWTDSDINISAELLHDLWRSSSYIHHMLYIVTLSSISCSSLSPKACQSSAPVGLWLMPVTYCTVPTDPQDPPGRSLFKLDQYINTEGDKSASAAHLDRHEPFYLLRLDYSSLMLWTLSEGKPAAAGGT